MTKCIHNIVEKSDDQQGARRRDSVVSDDNREKGAMTTIIFRIWQLTRSRFRMQEGIGGRREQ